MHQNVLNDLDIRQIKLINGEELVAFVQGAEGNGIWIESPLQISYDLHSADAMQSYYFVKWLAFSEDKIAYYLDESKIMISAECNDETKLRYIKIVSGVTEAPSSETVDDYEPEFPSKDDPEIVH